MRFNSILLSAIISSTSLAIAEETVKYNTDIISTINTYWHRSTGSHVESTVPAESTTSDCEESTKTTYVHPTFTSSEHTTITHTTTDEDDCEESTKTTYVHPTFSSSKHTTITHTTSEEDDCNESTKTTFVPPNTERDTTTTTYTTLNEPYEIEATVTPAKPYVNETTIISPKFYKNETTPTLPPIPRTTGPGATTIIPILPHRNSTVPNIPEDTTVTSALLVPGVTTAIPGAPVPGVTTAIDSPNLAITTAAPISSVSITPSPQVEFSTFAGEAIKPSGSGAIVLLAVAAYLLL